MSGAIIPRIERPSYIFFVSRRNFGSVASMVEMGEGLRLDCTRGEFLIFRQPATGACAMPGEIGRIRRIEDTLG